MESSSPAHPPSIAPLFPGRRFAAFLFDMDGTLLTSLAAAERVWADWARAHGVDVRTFLPTIHGRRSVDTIRSLDLPGIDPEAEARVITAREMVDVAGIRAIDGAARLLASLPRDRWAVVTSAPRALALRRMEAAGLPPPDLLIAAEDVARGKPAPDCYLLAASRLGADIRDCLVFEDAPAGIEAAQAAHAQAVLVTAMQPAPASWTGPCIRAYAETMSFESV